jgi:hypothetical protein
MTTTQTTAVPRARGRRAPPVDTVALVAMHGAGKTALEIATELHTSPPRIRALLRGAGVHIVSRRSPTALGAGQFFSYVTKSKRSSVYLRAGLLEEAREAFGVGLRQLVIALATDPAMPDGANRSAWVEAGLRAAMAAPAV